MQNTKTITSSENFLEKYTQNKRTEKHKRHIPNNIKLLLKKENKNKKEFVKMIDCKVFDYDNNSFTSSVIRYYGISYDSLCDKYFINNDYLFLKSSIEVKLKMDKFKTEIETYKKKYNEMKLKKNQLLKGFDKIQKNNFEKIILVEREYSRMSMLINFVNKNKWTPLNE